MSEEQKPSGKPREIVKLGQDVKEVPIPVAAAEPATPGPKPKKSESG